MFYRRVGDVPPKRHIQHRRPTGELYHEELVSHAGFSSDSSLLYHRNVPAAICRAEQWDLAGYAIQSSTPMLPRHFRLGDLFDETSSAASDVVRYRRLLVANRDVRISYVAAGSSSPLYRNATGDECVFVDSGTGVLETAYGTLAYRPGDYVVVPRATTHRWLPTGPEPTAVYCIEASSHVRPPRRYRSPLGQLLEHAPYCERDITGPTEPLVVEDGGEVEIYVKHPGDAPLGVVGSRWVVPHHPFDVVGWDGCCYPFILSIHDFEPITGRLHQPPPVHQVFEGESFVVCNFVPRLVDYHPLAVPVPYYHANVDSDEVMFYWRGNYLARRGSGVGSRSVSLHPAGYTHGPAPGAIEPALGATRFDESAVMIDTFRPLHMAPAARECEDPTYAGSWNR